MQAYSSKQLLLLLDFDGVLADSFEACYIANAKAFRFIGKNLDREEFRSFFDGNIYEALRVRIPRSQEFEYFSEARERAFREGYLEEVRLFPFVIALLPQLAPFVNIAIVSANRKPLVEALLNRHGLLPCIQGIFVDKINKKEGIERAIDFFDVSPAQGIFITDTAGDLQAAGSAKIRAVAVTWGFQSKASLMRLQPEYVAEDPLSLERYLFSIITSL